jgi:GDPmannose 4,6-dehydratase
VNRTIVVTGGTGQDARLLIPKLVAGGDVVHTLTRDASAASAIYASHRDAVIIHEADLIGAPHRAAALVVQMRPDVVFNLSGLSSVSESFSQPALTWRLNAEWVALLLESIRTRIPDARLYQASSSEMFGCLAGETVVHDEASPLRPQSPYAAAKAAAHLMCGVYRNTQGVRAACGILFNHESRYRGAAFLTTKVARHVATIRDLDPKKRASHPPLRVGRLDVQRDWGFAPDYVDGILLIADQIEVRRRVSGGNIPDDAREYRDYVLGTGVLTSVKDLIDAAFSQAGLPLTWTMEEDGGGSAVMQATGTLAVESVPEFRRAAEPKAIQADASRAWRELGWRTKGSIDSFLRDMIGSGETL